MNWNFKNHSIEEVRKELIEGAVLVFDNAPEKFWYVQHASEKIFKLSDALNSLQDARALGPTQPTKSLYNLQTATLEPWNFVIIPPEGAEAQPEVLTEWITL